MSDELPRLSGDCITDRNRQHKAAQRIMNTQSPVPKDHPLMKAWENYKQTGEYQNTRKWALYPEHVHGSLWAAFSAGFTNDSAPTRHPITPTATKEIAERCVEKLHYGTANYASHNLAVVQSAITESLAEKERELDKIKQMLLAEGKDLSASLNKTCEIEDQLTAERERTAKLEESAVELANALFGFLGEGLIEEEIKLARMALQRYKALAPEK